MTSSFSMLLGRVRSIEHAGEDRHCQPYVLVTGVDLRRTPPDVEIFLYGSWSRANSGPIGTIRPLVRQERFWQLEPIAAPIAKPDDVIFLIALMEHADGDPSAARNLVKDTIIRELQNSRGEAPDGRLAKLIASVNGAVDIANGGPNFTSAVAIQITQDHMAHLKGDGACTFLHSFSGYGGDYLLRFDLIKAERDFRYVSPQKDEVLACAAE